MHRASTSALAAFLPEITDLFDPRREQIRAEVCEWAARHDEYVNELEKWTARRKVHFEERVIAEPAFLDLGTEPEGMTWDGRYPGDDPGTFYQPSSGEPFSYARIIRRAEFERLLDDQSPLLTFTKCHDWFCADVEKLTKSTFRRALKKGVNQQLATEREKWPEEDPTDIRRQIEQYILNKLTVELTIDAWAPTELHTSREPNWHDPLPPSAQRNDLSEPEMIAALVAVLASGAGE